MSIIVLFLMLYPIFGFFYIYLKTYYDDSMDFWNTTQLIYVMAAWPIIIIIDILDRIKRKP